MNDRDRVAAVLKAYVFRSTDEEKLKEGMAQAFAAGGIVFEREIVLASVGRNAASNDKDRLDFFLPAGCAIEVKIKGSATEALLQIARYAEHPEVKEIVLVSTRRKHMKMPATLNGKPVSTVFVGWL